MISMTNSLKRLTFVFLTVCAMPLSSAACQQNSEPNSDTRITAAVKATILKDYSHIKVDTTNKIVHPHGTVNSNTEMDALVESIACVEGVKDVDTSDLSVQGSRHPFTDTVITAKVKGLLMQKKLLSQTDVTPWVKVETVDNTVYLSGEAQSIEQINQAIAIAKSVKGVKNVDYKRLLLAPVENPGPEEESK